MINELDPELFDKIENCINGRQDFRIGGRGIAVDVRCQRVTNIYIVDVPRASVEIHAYDVRLDRDDPALLLCDGARIIAVIDLCGYTKVTKI